SPVWHGTVRIRRIRTCFAARLNFQKLTPVRRLAEKKRGFR
ncbi:MAG: hypothetical protein QOJ99_5373, partial [Bryobacterales bacterium]|nr:hypothetical protein [Bryobacterales bacterium]